ncbi:penicillin-binding protein 1C [Falsigemmobacter faecalis]|uniref:peptidoglycan glycosyltransferase n=1 Tax=Falsigemmobacter faecalis TaxID=2488730 RepID=A0A3P3DMV8_9RHOB|nr:penicillin-binding protein 1C [Falsigemmobacter faecalis]RRH75553.1 penicillin-binding protein 1C [Falsigemmobacter faecalis]
MKARLVFALAAALWGAGTARDHFDAWIARTELPPLNIATGAEVVARDGQLLRAWTVADGRWRLAAQLQTTDPLWRGMLLAYEDRRFYRHSGIDLRAMARAAWQSARAGRVVSGGSTLTMQVARLLEESGTGRLAGKLRQMRLALALERQLSKDEILGLYLHLAPYGGNLEGLRAASLSWFAREPSRLTPAQAALLVALPQAPEARRPDRHLARAKAGRDRVLSVAEAAGLLEPEAAQAARSEALPRARRPFPQLAPHLTDRLRREDPQSLRIATTIDAALQTRLEALAREALRGAGERVQIALLLADHQSGEILASVGSAAYDNDARQGFVDMTRALRSPGSTLKPLVYAMAFDEGLAHPETLMEDRPVSFGAYAPQNFDRRFRGTIRVAEALRASLNIPVVTLTEALGPERLVQAMRRAGMRPVIPGRATPGLAVALGGVGVTLEDLSTLYAMLARGGRVRPLSPLPQARDEGVRLLSEVAAWQTGQILAGIPPPDGSPDGRIAWKTGTSYGHRDALALGWDGRYVAGVWMGRADGTPVPGAFGADLAAPVLFQMLARARPQPVPLPPPPPATLMVENARLPQPLQRFRPRGAILAPGTAPEISFPPDGAEVALEGAPLLARVRGGTAPYTWLANGAPLQIATRAEEVQLALASQGPLLLSVIDAKGRAARVRVTLSP